MAGTSIAHQRMLGNLAGALVDVCGPLGTTQSGAYVWFHTEAESSRPVITSVLLIDGPIFPVKWPCLLWIYLICVQEVPVKYDPVEPLMNAE